MAVVGTAFPMRMVEVPSTTTRPYRRLLASFPRMAPGDVVVIAGEESWSGQWGELLSIAARARGVAGVVCEGLVRDVDQICDMGFPVFARGASPLDSAGRQEVETSGEPVEIGGVDIGPGDFVIGDSMGVVVIPGELAEKVVVAAEEKRDGESTVRRELERGDPIEEVFDRHGIL